MATLWTLSLILLLPLLYYLLKPPSIPSIPNATPRLPFLGNAIFFGINPVKFLLDNRARHGAIFFVDLLVIRIIFCLGPEGTNAVLKGTERAGISLWVALEYVLGSSVKKSMYIRPRERD
jgi:sterol 14alpha-demethylase